MNLGKFAVAAAISIGLAMSSPAFAKGGSSPRPYYGGGKHTGSHGGQYQGGSGSSHKGGTYKNPKTGDQYGKHK